MNSRKVIEASLLSTAQLMHDMVSDDTLCDAVVKVAQVCVDALRSKKKILLCGNGGSAADAQHWAGELVSRFAYDRPGLAAMALTTDTSILTAIGNDYGYEKVFSRQVEAMGNEGDVLLGISTSGNSQNVILGLQAARKIGMVTVGFMGQSTGEMSALCDVCIHIPSACTPRVQEGHEALGHIICGLIEAAIFPQGGAS